VDVKLGIPDILGETIQTCRLNRAVKAEEMLQLLNCSAHHYSAIENGHSHPGYNALIAILRYLCIDPNVFVYPEKEHLDLKRLQMIHAVETCDEEQLNFLIAVWNGLPKK
jgi:transcriptional regulator with XRE-family HTH domain